MGTPIFGTQYVLDFTPEGEEHPNVIDRFVKQEHFCDTHCVWTNHHSDCALAQPEPVIPFSVNPDKDDKRKPLPLSDDEIKCIKPICADFVSFRAGVRHAEREHGIGGEE